MFRLLTLFAGTQSDNSALEKYWKKRKFKVVKTYKGVITHYNISNENGIYWEVETIGVDIYSPVGVNMIFDLSQPNVVKRFLKGLPENWPPDFISAGPVCNKFSRVVTGTGGNYYFELNKKKKKIKPRKNWNIKIQPHLIKYQNKKGWKKNKKDAKEAIKLFENTKKIINHFNVPFFIENPSTALSQYLLKEYIKNKTSYCMYGFDYQKNTTFYSNEKLDLKKCNHKKHDSSVVGGKKHTRPKHWKSVSTYANRASVPEDLLISIFKQTGVLL